MYVIIDKNGDNHLKARELEQAQQYMKEYQVEFPELAPFKIGYESAYLSTKRITPE